MKQTLLALCGLLVIVGGVMGIKMMAYADYTSNPSLGFAIGMSLFFFIICGLSLLVYSSIQIIKEFRH